MIEVKAASGKPESFATDMLVIGMFEGETGGAIKAIDSRLESAISKIVKEKQFKGAFKESESIYTFGKIPAKRVLVLGLGKSKAYDIEKLRKLSAVAGRAAKSMGCGTFCSVLHEHGIQGKSLREKSVASAEGMLLGLYEFDMYKSKDKQDVKKKLESAVMLNADSAGIEKGKIIASATIFARDLINQPASIKTPEVLAKEAEKICRKNGISIKVFDKKGIERLGLQALLAVNAGSVNEPRFVIMEYGRGKETFAFVGKGITFDSGGLNLKPTNYIETMKDDMSGAAVVMGVMKAASELKLPVHIIGVFAATENMPGQKAYKPGDVVRAYNGKTIEIGNTDAEGRVVLSDALSYTSKHYKPTYMIDIATLTGAMAVALGSVAGILGNDKGLLEKAKKAGLDTYERVWEMPLYEEYKEAVKGDIGDVRNIGTGKGYGQAGGITAAGFLSNFIGKEKWMHIDIAGSAWCDLPEDYISKGGTGFGIRLLVRMLEDWKKKSIA